MMAPEQAPPGVTLRFLPRPSGAAWATWLRQYPAPAQIWNRRPIIVPRLLLVHTNGASGEGNAASAYNWAMSAPNNTKPHYQVDRDGSAVKFLPSNRMGIGNYKVSDFSLVVETADAGYGAGKPGQACAFTSAQGEMVAQIIAWEAELWGFDIDYPARWDGSGVGCHTEPFGYPLWTNANGKVCPGRQKKLDMVNLIMPRARDILDPPPPPTPPPQPSGDDEMPFTVKVRGFNAAYIRWTDGSMTWIRAEDAGSVFAKYGPPVEVADQTELAKIGTIIGQNPGPV